MLTKTDAMQWGSHVEGGPADDAGLVLVFAPDFEKWASAHVLGSESLVIGRAPPPGGLAIPQRAVSQLHARIFARDGAWAIKDLESRNGTLVNGHAVRETVLRDFDQIRIGDAIFKFVAANAGAYLPYRIDGQGPNANSSLVGGYQVHAALEQLAAIATTELSVIVQGETGTGKELVARAIHDASARRGQLVALNCAAIPMNLVESELFGFKRGAFTGADRDKVGLVRAAHGGTLFLDEIGDMPLETQAKLLRVIETRQVLPVGATTGEPVAVRFVCATHHDLSSLVAQGRFRGDLFARLNGASVRLPPLRERKEDLYALVRHFLAQAGAPRASVDITFMAGVCHYDWPYNVRELEAAIRRAVAVAKGPTLSANELPDAVRAMMRTYGSPAAPAAPPVSSQRDGQPTPEELRELLARHKGNIASVAREVGRDRAQVHRWMRYAGIDPQAFRDR